jgi:hypothetical protein
MRWLAARPGMKLGLGEPYNSRPLACPLPIVNFAVSLIEGI